MSDATDGKGGPKLEVKGFPTSYMIFAGRDRPPSDKSDRAVKSLEDGVADFAKRRAPPSRSDQGYLTALENATKAVADGKWKPAVTAYLSVDAVDEEDAELAARLSPRRRFERPRWSSFGS